MIVLVHSPLTGPEAWGELPAVLHERGREVVVVDLADDDQSPFASRFVVRAAVQVRDAVNDSPAILVGHSGAGVLLPPLGAARRAARAAVAGYVFLDAGLPPARPVSQLDLIRGEGSTFAQELEALLESDGRFPDWTDDDLRELVPDDAARSALLASLRPRGADYFTEVLPVVADWPDAPCGFLRLSPTYDGPARQAAQRGWPVVNGPDDRPGGHFAMLVDPQAVADDLEMLLQSL